MDIVIDSVGDDQVAAVAPLTWATFRAGLALPADERARLRLVARAAWAGGRPVGLALSAGAGAGTQTVLSLVVAADWRRRGLGRMLLRDLGAGLRLQGVGMLRGQASDRLPGYPALTALLAAEGWAAPEPIRRRFGGPVGKTLSVFRHRSGVYQRLLRQGMRLLSWRDAGGRALDLVAEMSCTGEMPDWADPHVWLDRLHPDYSMVLSDAHGAVRGWVMCQHQPELDRWFFPVGWLREPQASQGWLLGAYAEGARRLGEDFGDHTRVAIETGLGLPAMLRVFDRHFVPHADCADTLMEMRRVL